MNELVNPAELDAASIAALREAVGAVTMPIIVVANPEPDGEAGPFSWDRQLVDPALVEVLLDEQAPVRVPAGAPETYRFSLKEWSERDALAEDTLAKVIAHPFFSRVLVNSFLPRHETNAVEANWLEHAAHLDSFTPVFDALAHEITAMCERWTLGALDAHGAWLESLLRPAILRRAPAIAAAARSLRSWRLLQAQLRAGIMDEWGWPAQDEALQRLGAKPTRNLNGPPPYVVYMEDGEATQRRIIAFGPDDIVFDEVFTPSSTDMRNFFYTDGDVLACAHPTTAMWIKTGGAIPVDPYHFLEHGTGDGAPIANTLVRVARGDTMVRGTTTRLRKTWFDGATYYALDAESVRADGSADRGRLLAFDPTTGATRPTALPAWFASRLATSDDVVMSAQSDMQIVPPTGVTSPLGARDGIGAGALFTRDHQLHFEGIDGRSASGWVNGQLVGALMTFPERDGYYPIIGSNHGIAMPDTTPLVPMDALYRGAIYWGGTPSLPLSKWYALRPRDPAASRALAACTDDAAKDLLAAVTAPAPVHDAVIDYGTMQAVLVAAPTTITPDDQQRAAVQRIFPAVTHPRMQTGILCLAAHAKQIEATIARIHSRLASALAPSVVESTFQNKDASSFAVLVDHGMHWWVEQDGIQLGQQILDVSRYLFTDDDDAPRTPAATRFPWDMLLARASEVMYRALACATPKQHREQLAAFLAMWREAELCTHLSSIRVATMALPASLPALAGLAREAPDRLATWTNRYFIRFRGIEGANIVALVIESTRDGVFRLPHGAELREQFVVDTRATRAAIDTTIGLVKERGRVDYDATLVDIVARETGLSRAAAALAWGAGYQPWLLGDKARQRMHVSRDELDTAELELRGKRLHELYVRAMPEDPREMFTPTGARQFADAWNAIYGKQSPFPSELVAGLRADLRDDTLPLASDARMLVAPDAATFLTRDETWVIRPTSAFDAGKRRFEGWLPAGWPLVAGHETRRNPDCDDWFHGYGIGRFVRYLAWAYLALPGGDPVRANILRAAELIRARLANDDLLVLAAAFDLSGAEAPDVDALVEPLRTAPASAGVHPVAPYRAADGGESALGFDRGDIVVTWPEAKNGVFIAVRPSRITGPAHLAAIAAAVGVTRYGVQRTTQRLGAHAAFGPASFGDLLAWAAPGFQRLLVDAATTPNGVLASDPRVTGADAVAAVRVKHRLSELGAAHYLLRAIGLTDRRAAKLLGADASAELVSLPAPDPRAVHGLADDEEPIFGHLLPLVPFADLWAVAAR